MAFSDQEQARLTFLTHGAVLRTKRGCRRRLAIISFEDLRLLMRHFQCDVGSVEDRLYLPPGGRRD